MTTVLFADRDGASFGPLGARTVPALLPLGGIPVLERALEALVRAGRRSALLVVGPRAGEIERRFGKGIRWGIALEIVRIGGRRDARRRAAAARAAARRRDDRRARRRRSARRHRRVPRESGRGARPGGRGPPRRPSRRPLAPPARRAQEEGLPEGAGCGRVGEGRRLRAARALRGADPPRRRRVVLQGRPPGRRHRPGAFGARPGGRVRGASRGYDRRGGSRRPLRHAPFRGERPAAHGDSARRHPGERRRLGQPRRGRGDGRGEPPHGPPAPRAEEALLVLEPRTRARRPRPLAPALARGRPLERDRERGPCDASRHARGKRRGRHSPSFSTFRFETAVPVLRDLPLLFAVRVGAPLALRRDAAHARGGSRAQGAVGESPERSAGRRAFARAPHGARVRAARGGARRGRVLGPDEKPADRALPLRALFGAGVDGPERLESRTRSRRRGRDEPRGARRHRAVRRPGARADSVPLAPRTSRPPSGGPFSRSRKPASFPRSPESRF